MKKAFTLSIILHIVIILVSIQMIDIKKETKKQDFFYADIVRPDMLKGYDRESASETKRDTRPYKPQSKKVIPKEPKPDIKTERQRDTKKTYPDVAKRDNTSDGSMQTPSLPQRSAPVLPSDPSLSQPKKEDIPRDRLFDRKIIRDIAKANRPETKQDDSITFDTKEFKYHGYLRRLKDRIEGVWRYPQEAAERGIYGDLYIKFTIKKNGRLGEVELLRTSGHRLLDEAALKALRDADPFWPLPDELGKESFTITGHFVYSIYGIYLR
ncbi:MAG: energy transducer TonB [Thermodesulfovibrionales bacterium]|nr:energy transducer TonB [Thermodesulfovibrionales bacterium]